MEFSKDKFIQIIEGIKECYFEVDLKGNFTYFNESLRTLTGYSKEELLGLSYKYIADKESRIKLFEGFNSVYMTGEPLTDFEYQFRNKAGEKIIGETSVYLKYDSGGKKIGFFGIFRDVTKRKEEEQKFKQELEHLVNKKTQELRESEEKYRFISESAMDLIAIINMKMKFEYINEKIHKKVMGYEKEELIGKNAMSFIHPDDRKEVLKAFKNASEKGESFAEVRIRHKDGYYKWIGNNGSIYIDKDGKPKFLIIARDITEHKKAEIKLMESEDKYHQLFNKSLYPIGLFDLEGNLIDCNSATSNLLSTHVIDDLIGKNYREFWTYDKRDEPLVSLFNNVFGKIISTGETIDFEFPIHRTIGGIIWSYATASKIKIGKEEFVQIILMDITAQKEAQQKLKQSEERYRNLVENAQEGVWAVDENDDTIFVNPKLCEMLGYSREEMMNKNLHFFLESPMIDIVDSYRERRVKGLKDTYELDFIKKDGTILSTSINASPILNENGDFKGSFAFITDITNKKLAEQKLKESEARYRNLIESVPFSIILIDQQGTVQYCNPNLEKLINYNKNELIGTSFKDLPAINPEYIPVLLRRFQKVIKGDILPPLDMEIYKKDGTSIWIRYQSSLVKLGEQIFLQAVINDITEQRKADLLIEEELVKLKDLDQIRKDLISRVSHELKTPLVSVCGAAELILDLYIDQFKGETKELIEMIEKGGKRLKYLVDNLVDITRIEYRKFELEMDTNDISQVIRDCAKELMYLIKKRELVLELDLLDNLFLKFDKVRIEQVILNLLSNAVKNTPPNGKITVKSSIKDDSVELIVQDTGIGLIKEEMDKLFTRFGKIERYGNGLEYIDIQGTGLGLFISKEIIDLHKGQIWAISPGRNKGSTFTIKIPIQS
ncbi:MAG: PAS domain S-box protein [Promethearchaeota archaeon]